MKFRQTLKDLTLPIAMLVGVLFHRAVAPWAFLTPYCLFVMLLLTFTKMSPGEVRIRPLHGWLLLIQLAGCMLVYGTLRFFDPVVAESALICVLAPTATSAVVITGMLGGNIAFLAACILITNLGLVIAAPVIFSLLGTHSQLPFWEAFFFIFRQVFLLLILPMLCAWFMRRFTPRLHNRLMKIHKLSFYLWAAALTILTGKIIVFLIDQEQHDYRTEIFIGLVSLAICIVQFLLGRWLGRRHGDAVSAGQGLGQKNTILAIWMAQSYLNPIASIGPAMYVIWQNCINSYQLWLKRRDSIKN